MWHQTCEAAYSLNINYKTAYANKNLRTTSSQISADGGGWQTLYCRERAAHQLYSGNSKWYQVRQLRQPQRQNQHTLFPQRCLTSVMPSPRGLQLAFYQGFCQMNHNESEDSRNSRCEYESTCIPLDSRMVSGVEVSKPVPKNMAWPQQEFKDYQKAKVEVVQDEVIPPTETSYHSLANRPPSRNYPVTLTKNDDLPLGEEKDDSKSDKDLLRPSDKKAIADQSQIDRVNGNKPMIASKKPDNKNLFKNKGDYTTQSIKQSFPKKSKKEANLFSPQPSQTSDAKEPTQEIAGSQLQRKKPSIVIQSFLNESPARAQKNYLLLSRLPNLQNKRRIPKTNGSKIQSPNQRHPGRKQDKTTSDSVPRVLNAKWTPTLTGSKLQIELQNVVIGQTKAENILSKILVPKFPNTESTHKTKISKVQSAEQKHRDIDLSAVTECISASQSKLPDTKNIAYTKFSKATPHKTSVAQKDTNSAFKSASKYIKDDKKLPSTAQDEGKQESCKISKGLSNLGIDAESSVPNEDIACVSMKKSAKTLQQVDTKTVGETIKTNDALLSPVGNEIATQYDDLNLSVESSEINSYIFKPIAITSEATVQHPKQAPVRKYIESIQADLDDFDYQDSESLSDTLEDSKEEPAPDALKMPGCTAKKSLESLIDKPEGTIAKKSVKQPSSLAPVVEKGESSQNKKGKASGKKLLRGVCKLQKSESPCRAKTFKPIRTERLSGAGCNPKKSFRRYLRQHERALLDKALSDKKAQRKSLTQRAKQSEKKHSLDSTCSTSCKFLVRGISDKFSGVIATGQLQQDSEKLSVTNSTESTALRVSNRKSTTCMYDPLGDGTSKSSMLSDFMRPFRESQKARERRLACREFGIKIDEAQSHELFIYLISAEVSHMFGYHAYTIDKIAKLSRCRIRLKRAILNRQTNGSQTWARFAQIEIDGKLPLSVKTCDRILCEKFPFYKERRVVTKNYRSSGSTVSLIRNSSDNSLLAFTRQRYPMNSTFVRWSRRRSVPAKMVSTIIQANDAPPPPNGKFQVISADSQQSVLTAEADENLRKP